MTAERRHDDDGEDVPGGGFAPARREPAIDLPPLIMFLVVTLTAIHALRVFLLSPETDRWVIFAFAFIPARYGELADAFALPMAAWWSPLTYAGLHGDWTHLIVNLAWMLAFGTPVARRMGTRRAGAIALLSALGGAAAHFVSYPSEMVPVIGASGVVAGFMGAAARFVFTGAPLRLVTHAPAQSLAASFSNPRFLTFLLVWLLINFIFGAGAIPLAGEGVMVAWQAHIGGFLAGLLGFSLLDRR